MPARKFFVGLDAAADLAEGKNGSNGIYLGSDGYLFPKPSKDSELLTKNAGFIKEFADDIDRDPGIVLERLLIEKRVSYSNADLCRRLRRSFEAFA